MTMLIVTCECGQQMKVPDSALGKTGTCVSCGRRLKITKKNAREIEPQPPPLPSDAASKRRDPVVMRTSTDPGIVEIAKRQRVLLWFVLVRILELLVIWASVIKFQLRTTNLSLFMCLMFVDVIFVIATVIVIIRLMTAVGMSVAAIVGLVAAILIGTVFPCGGLVSVGILLWANDKATKELQAAGYRVGLMGVSSRDIK